MAKAIKSPITGMIKNGTASGNVGERVVNSVAKGASASIPNLKATSMMKTTARDAVAKNKKKVKNTITAKKAVTKKKR